MRSEIIAAAKDSGLGWVAQVGFTGDDVLVGGSMSKESDCVQLSYYRNGKWQKLTHFLTGLSFAVLITTNCVVLENNEILRNIQFLK